MAHALRRQLRNRIRLVVSTAAPSTQPATAPTGGEPLAQTLQRARRLYIGMHMAGARTLLLRAWQRQLESKAKTASAAELAKLHAYLVAVYDAMGDQAGVRQHSNAAVRFSADLALDEDIFTPTVRAALARARQRRAALQVTIHSYPVPGSVFWDGTSVGKSPVTLRAQAKGAHLLRIEHPLFLQWGGRIELATSVELKPQLTPKPPGAIVDAVSQRPDLGPLAVRLLGTDGLLLVQKHPDGLALTLYDAAGKTSYTLRDEPGSAQRLARVTRLRLKQARQTRPTPILAVTPTSRPSSRPTKTRSLSHFRRYWWTYAILGGVAIAGAIVLPLTLSPAASRRDLVVEIP